MNVIMIRGASRSGKTTTLNKLFKYFLEDSVSAKTLRNSMTKDDFWSEFTYKGVKIGIMSMGDILGEVKTYKSYFERQACDWFICACNNRFSNIGDIFDDCNSCFVLKKTSNDDADEKYIISKIIDILNREKDLF